jgi:hypothetical protein
MRVSDAGPSRELLEWFDTEVDEGDAPELHLTGLLAGDLSRCFSVIAGGSPRWSDRTFHIDADARDYTVSQRPDVAELVASGQAPFACIGAEGIKIAGVELPLLEMFLFASAIQFFWWPSSAWTVERVSAFFALLVDLLKAAPTSKLTPDPRYPAASRRRLVAAIAAFIGEPARVDAE